eukprot:SAG11_NODE_2666_length_3114_cov_6.157877_2_plen_281_part_00
MVLPHHSSTLLPTHTVTDSRQTVQTLGVAGQDLPVRTALKIRRLETARTKHTVTETAAVSAAEPAGGATSLPGTHISQMPQQTVMGCPGGTVRNFSENGPVCNTKRSMQKLVTIPAGGTSVSVRQNGQGRPGSVFGLPARQNALGPQALEKILPKTSANSGLNFSANEALRDKKGVNATTPTISESTVFHDNGASDAAHSVQDAASQSAGRALQRVEWERPRDVLTAPWPWSRVEQDDDYDPELPTEVKLQPVWKPTQQGERFLSHHFPEHWRILCEGIS